MDRKPTRREHAAAWLILAILKFGMFPVLLAAPIFGAVAIGPTERPLTSFESFVVNVAILETARE